MLVDEDEEDPSTGSGFAFASATHVLIAIFNSACFINVKPDIKIYYVRTKPPFARSVVLPAVVAARAKTPAKVSMLYIHHIYSTMTFAGRAEP